MQIQSTQITNRRQSASGTSATIRLRLADTDDPSTSLQWLEAQVLTASIQAAPLEIVEINALQELRSAIDAEIQRLKTLAFQAGLQP